MTLLEVLEETIKILNKIEVPISMAEQIARPILGCVSNLNECVRALKENEKKQKAEEPEAAVSDGEVPEDDLHNGNEYGE